ncbi:MAG: glutamate synthase subunit alpha, partial [Actinomycetota bacterium]|nr:glutamate synthase subunit alpha [Actinomycetota bacterium]
MKRHPSLPPAAGLYDPALEHDGCGVAFVARLNGERSHECVRRAITALENMEHRGAEGADANTGDGAGILLQVPDEFLRASVDADLPPLGRYGVAVCFLPSHERRRAELEDLLEGTVEDEGQRVIGWRDVPYDQRHVGDVAWRCAPCIRQLFVAASEDLEDQDAFERKLYVIRKVAEKASDNELAVASFSSRTMVYKGMLSAPQLPRFYLDLSDERLKSALALVHSRFSTNTFPSWELAHPYRMIAHNGEVNTLMGNKNWMRARESELASELFGDDMEKVLPVIRPGGSDSATIDNVLELLVLAGRSLPHAVMMLIPEAHEKRDDLPEDLKGFYDFHSCLMEPWDGPAAVSFTDGRIVGATLDRNGLRPGRWVETRGGWVVLASEAGTLRIPPDEVLRKGRLKPGSLFMVDIERGEIFAEREVECEVATAHPYGRWYEERTLRLEELDDAEPPDPPTEPLRARQLAFGYSQEDLRVLIAPMAEKAKEPVGSMGNDAALAVLSSRQPPLFSYFKQLFAQVTNPAIDPVREDIVMSLGSAVGGARNLLEESPEHAHRLVMAQPVLRDFELEKVRRLSSEVFRTTTIDITWPVAEGPEGMEDALERICREAHQSVADTFNTIILSDRGVGPERVAIPSLLAVAAVHHHLVREGVRLRTGLVVESGEPREVHHVACLVGYGASAVNPYLMFESLREMIAIGELPPETPHDEAEQAVVQAFNKGLLKILSKMGISTIQSYCGAQIFEAVGLEPSLIDRHFTGTASRVGGVGLRVLAEEALERHARGFGGEDEELLPVGGIY